MKIWLVKFPTHQYKEDVKALAVKAGLKIIDEKYKDSIDPKLVADEVPSLSLKRKPKAKKKE